MDEVDNTEVHIKCDVSDNKEFITFVIFMLFILGLLSYIAARI